MFAPNAKAAEEQIQADMKQAYKETDPADEETQAKVDQLDELLDDPKVRAALLKKLNE